MKKYFVILFLLLICDLSHAARYWVLGTGTWDASNTANWSATDGGSGGASVPSSTDDVFFTANSGGGTVTLTISSNILSLNTIGFTGTITVNSSTNRLITIGGTNGLTLSAGVITVYNTIYIPHYTFTNTCTVTTAGNPIGNITINGSGKTVTLNDDIDLAASNTTALTLTAGTLDAGGHNITIERSGALAASSSNVKGLRNWNILTFGNLSQSASVVPIGTFGANTTITTPGKILIKTMPSSNLTLAGNGLTWGNLEFATANVNHDTTHTWTISGSNTWGEFKAAPGYKFIFTDGTTQTVSSLNLIGTGTTATKQIVLTGSSTAGWTVSDPSGTNACTYLRIYKSTATGGATFTATNSKDSGSNSGWTITPPIPPASSSGSFNFGTQF